MLPWPQLHHLRNMSHEPEPPNSGEYLLFGLGQAFTIDVVAAALLWLIPFLQHWLVFGLWGPALAALIFWVSWQVDEPSIWMRVCGPLLASGAHLTAVVILRHLMEAHPLSKLLSA